MTNTLLLEDRMRFIGLTVFAAAKLLGITPRMFNKKARNKALFDSAELGKLKYTLRLNHSEFESIFFQGTHYKAL